MEGESLTIDQREQQLIEDERLIGQLRARQISNLAILDEAQIANADGARSLSEWTAARLDVGPETARSLVRTMRRLQERPDLERELGAGELSYERVEALSRMDPGSGSLKHLDVAALRREAAKRARITAEAEYRTASDRFVVMQPNLDESWWRLWGGLDGPSGALVDKALFEKADQLPDLPDGAKTDTGWRKATALVELCVSGEAPPAQVTVFVDAKEAASTRAEAGVVLEAGPRAGRLALQAVLCDATTEVIARTEDGRYLDYGRKQRTVSPTLKRALLDKWSGRCAADGCTSRHRLQAHHVTPWSLGGETNQADLSILCWFHHQVVVHERGFDIVAHPETGRIRFAGPDPPPEYRSI